MNKKGFTLIELLIVVAIIGILAAIAIPNFLNAQVRSKIARAKADMRTLTTGMESYYVDYNNYPLASQWQVATKTLSFPTLTGADRGMITLSTPVAYITNGLIEDPFPGKTRNVTNPGNLEYIWYGYTGRNKIGGTSALISEVGNNPEVTTVEWYILQSSGPDLNRSTLGSGICTYGTPADFIVLIYDPTNGTVSKGSVFRAGGSPSGNCLWAFSMIQGAF